MIRIDVLDASDNKIGTGPITSAEKVTIRRSLDKMGGCNFPVMAVDPKTAVIGAGRKYQIFHVQYGRLGTFRHANQSLAAGSDKPALSVNADDRLIELAQKNGYFRRNFNYVAVESVVGSLLTVAGWTAGSLETGIGNTTVSYEGESIFEALDVLRDRWGVHFRLGSVDRTLDFGSFGDDSGIRLIRSESVPRELTNNDNVALITALEIMEESEAIINRLIPVGAGAGTTQLTLQYANSTHPSYPVLTGTNADGSSFYYIEDTTSQNDYGLVERPFERSDILPLTNSTPDLQNAANALYRAALAALLKWKGPRTYYQVSVTKLDPRRLRPGDKVRIVFRGVATYRGQKYKWVDVDELLWVLDIEETYSADGKQSVKLEVATTGDRRTSDGDILAKLTRDVSVFKTHVQPNLTHSPTGPYVKRMDSSRPATFNVRLKEEVLAVNRAIMRFQTAPLRSSVQSVASQTINLNSTNSETINLTSTNSETINLTSTNNKTINLTTTNDENLHGHQLRVYHDSSPAGSAVYLKNGLLKANYGVDVNLNTGSGNAHAHSITMPSHNHTISMPGHSHSISMPSHSHSISMPGHTHPMSYGLYEDTLYPQSIRVSINGTDRTAALGGPWAAGGGAVDVEVNITSYLVRGQDNTVNFSCTSGRGEITFLGDCLLTIQAIVVS